MSWDDREKYIVTNQLNYHYQVQILQGFTFRKVKIHPYAIFSLLNFFNLIRGETFFYFIGAGINHNTARIFPVCIFF